MTPGVTLGFMLILKTKTFNKWMRSEKISIDVLRQATKEIMNGHIDANLGGQLFKKRIPLPGIGKRGGARTVLAYAVGKRIVFLEGFAKNEKSNLTADEKKALQKSAKIYLGLDEMAIRKAVKAHKLIEVKI